LRDTHDIEVVDEIKDIDEGFPADIIVLAVKPQGMDEALEGCKRYEENAAFLSIAAGKPLSYFEERLNGAPIVRVMPNTPAAVRRGISVACANDKATKKIKGQCSTLLEAIGEVAWVDDEGLMDAVTAVSGSGPAYVFYLTECLTDAGVKAGLDEELATRLARATVAGAGELMNRSGTEAGQLRQNVTSPGGTTEAALKVLMGETGISSIFDDAVAAATARSKELAG
jgi:pyrroline-5-carboxylate reductase